MSGISNGNNESHPQDPGASSNNYDYIQHSTIHPHPSPQQQSMGYYHHQPAHYPNDQQQQYYQQPQHYYQNQEGLPQQPPWPTNHAHNQQPQYHHQHQYYQQTQTQYHQNPNPNYHHQQPPPPHPQPIHQLSSFVNHGHNPQSPSSSTAGTPTVLYPSTTPSPSSFASQASASPQHCLSPTRPGPGSSPGTVSNHMMPVRLQNMARGARTKAGMRKLMQMQEKQEEKSSAPPPIVPKVPTPGSPKKSKGKKTSAPVSLLKVDGDTSSSLTSTTTSIDEAIEAAVLSSLPVTQEETESLTQNVADVDNLVRSKPNLQPGGGTKIKGKKTQEKVNDSKVATKSTLPNVEGTSEKFSSQSIKVKRPFFTYETAGFPIQNLNPMPSDLLFEKLGLSQSGSKKVGLGKIKKSLSSPPQKKQRMSTNIILSPNEEIIQSEEPILPFGGLKELSSPRTRQSQLTLINAPEIESSKKTSPKRNALETKEKSPMGSLVKSTTNTKKAIPTPAATVSPNTRKSKASAGVPPLIPMPSKGGVHESPSAGANQKSPTSQLGLGRKTMKGDNGPFGGMGTSIADVAAAIIAPVSGVIALKKKGKITSKMKVKKKKKLPSKNVLTEKSKSSPVLCTTATIGVDLEIEEIKPTPIVRPAAVSMKPTPAKRKYILKKPRSATQPPPPTSEIDVVKEEKKVSHLVEKGKKLKSDTSLLSSDELESGPPKLTPAVGGEVSWMVNLLEKRPLELKKLKTPTVWRKASCLPQALGAEMKKETGPGPSLKVKHGVVKFYRGSDEEDVDESFKKLDAVLKESVSKDCDDDIPWLCVFCGLGPHDMRLGDLFGPYFVKDLPKRKIKGKILPETKKEVWVHTDCALWAGDVILVGSTLRNLDETVREAGKVVCKICENVGATIGCLKRGCGETAHYPCAKLNDWNLNGETYHSHCRAHFAEANQKQLPRSTSLQDT